MEIYPLWLPSDVNLIFRDCYYLPVVSRNLISVSCLVQKNYVISFHKDYYTIYFENKMIGSDFLINSLYRLYVDVSVNLIK